MKIGKSRTRKGISPVLATVILIAITLIAAIAIAGFVFGLFGSFTSTAQVQGIQTYVTAADASKTTGLTSATCSATSGTDYIAFKNTGTSSATISAFTLKYGGQTYSIAATAGVAGACTVTAGGAAVYVNLVFTGTTGIVANAGEQYIGSVSLSNGASPVYTGSFY